MLANPARGECLIAIGGQRVRLCLTLGALASLEAALDVAHAGELAARLETLSASDMLIVLAALSEGGGVAWSVEALRTAEIAPREAAAAIARAFQLAFADAD
jgi:hypothetical protein